MGNEKSYVCYTLRMPKDEKEKIKQLAEKAGKSFNRYVIDCALKPPFVCPHNQIAN